MQLSRIDRITRTFDAASLLKELDPTSLTGVSVALLPPRTSPTAATVWTSVTFAAPTATVLFAGPDADSTGAVVVTGSADLWIKAGAGVEIETVKVERITLIGEGQPVTALPGTYVTSVNGFSGTVGLVTTYVDHGDGTADAFTYATNDGSAVGPYDPVGSANAAQTAAVTAAAIDATAKANAAQVAAQSYAARAAAGMTLILGRR